GLMPALRGSTIDLTPALKENAAALATSHRVRWSFGQSLVAGQLALSLCLLIGAGLFISSLHRITVLDPGFRVENLLFVGFDASGSGYKLDLVQERLLATLSGFFGPLALLLASIGLY